MAFTPTGALNYSHQNALGTTTVKSGAGLLHSLTINTKGATSNIATLYDNTSGSGTVIAVVDLTSQILTLLFDVGFNTGLTVVISGGTSGDITISYQ
jgi:hypothetical protein